MAILTFNGFNELDAFMALGIVNRAKTPGWRVSPACLPAEADPAG